MSTVRYDPATECTGPQPGLIVVRNHWGRVTGLPNYGIYACRSVRGGSSRSVHSEGRAVDLGADARNPRHTALADHFCRFIDHFAVELQAQYWIWNRRQKKPGEAWRSYSGASNHTDHIHLELNKTGASELTEQRIQELWHEYVTSVEPQPEPYTPDPHPEVPSVEKDFTPIPVLPVPKCTPSVQLLRLDDAGGPVVSIQVLLNQKASLSPPLAVDGHYGPKTQQAVTNWQRFFGLVPDGIAGEKTWHSVLGL